MSVAAVQEDAPKLTKAVIFDFRLDVFFPLSEQPIVYMSNEYPVKPIRIHWKCTHFTSEEGRKNAFEIPTTATVLPSPSTRAHFASPVTDVRIAYEFMTPMTPDGVDALFGTQMWRFSDTGLGSVLRELNRVIDLYRLGNFPAYLTDYISPFNFVQYSHVEIDTADAPFNQMVGTGKSFQMGSVPEVSAELVANGSGVPFHFRLYLNARKALAEGRYLQMQVEVSNAVEAASKALIGAANKIATKPLSSAYMDGLDYRGRFNQAQRLLHEQGFKPSKTYKVSALRDICMEHRNDAMHGNEKFLTLQQANPIIEALSGLMDYIYEATLFVQQRTGKPVF